MGGGGGGCEGKGGNECEGDGERESEVRCGASARQQGRSEARAPTSWR